MSLWIGQMEPFAGSISRFFLSPGQEIALPVSCQIFAGGRTIENGHQEDFLVEVWTDLNDHGESFSAIPMTFLRQSDLYYEYEASLILKTTGAFRFTVRFSPDGGKSWIYQNDFYQGEKPCIDAFLVASAEWIQSASLYAVSPEAFPTLEELDNGLAYISSLGTDIVYLPAGDPESLGPSLDALIKRAHALGLKVVLDFVVSRFQSAKGNFGYYNDAEDWIEMGSFDQAFWDKMAAVVPDWMDRHGIDGICCQFAQLAPARFWQKAINAIKRVKPDALVIGNFPGGDGRVLLRAFDAVKGDLWHSLQGFPSGRDIKYFFLGRDSQYPKRSGFLQFVESPDTTIRSVVRWGSSQTAFLRFAIAATTPGLPLIQNGQEISDAVQLPLGESCTVDWSRFVGESKVLHLYSKLMHVRRELPTLCRGRTFFLNMEPEQDSIFAFLRYDSEGAVLVAINLDAYQEQKASFRLPIWELKMDSAHSFVMTDRWNEGEPGLYSGQHLSAGLPVTLPPNGLVIATFTPKAASISAGKSAADV
ncbi:MAG TPA: hypothetical protein V6C82_04050 [Chroococcales cyanobacterium]|jgi:hypothetical protein